MEDAKSVWNSKQEISQILQPFWTSRHRQSYCFVQRKGHFLTIHTQRTQTFWHQNLQTMWQDWIHVGYNFYLDRDRERTVKHLTETHVTVSELTKKIQGHGHKLYMDNYFFSPDLFDDLAMNQIYCCGSARQLCKLVDWNSTQQRFFCLGLWWWRSQNVACERSF